MSCLDLYGPLGAFGNSPLEAQGETGFLNLALSFSGFVSPHPGQGCWGCAKPMLESSTFRRGQAQGAGSSCVPSLSVPRAFPFVRGDGNGPNKVITKINKNTSHELHL